MAEGPSLIELVVRLGFSLGVIIGLLALGAKVARRNGGALRLPSRGGRNERAIKVIDRQSLTRTASLAVVQVGARTMVVGVTEQGISLLTDDADLTVESPERTDRSVPLHLVAAPAGDEPRSPVEAERTTPPPPLLVADAADASRDSASRMSLVEALRELTVRKA